MKHCNTILSIFITLLCFSCKQQTKEQIINPEKADLTNRVFLGLKQIDKKYTVYQDCNTSYPRIHVFKHTISEDAGMEKFNFNIKEFSFQSDTIVYSLNFTDDQSREIKFKFFKNKDSLWEINNKLYVDSLDLEKVKFINKPKCIDCYSPQECIKKGLLTNTETTINSERIKNLKGTYFFHSNVFNESTNEWVDDVDYEINFKDNLILFKGEGRQMFFEFECLSKKDDNEIMIFFKKTINGGYEPFENTNSPILSIINNKGKIYIKSSFITYEGKSNNLIPLDL